MACSKPSTKASTHAFRIAINLDITGSMGLQLEACKSTVAQFVTLLQGLELPLSFAMLTFTESNKHGCFVSLAEFTDLAAARNYVQRIKLSRPPDAPNVSNASGDDGDENHKAALARMLDLEPLPTVAFMITDAPPHLKAGRRSPTSDHELRYLTGQRRLDRSIASDFFRVFRLLLNHFSDQLVMNCVAYPGAPHEIFGALAQQTGGMLMVPNSQSPDVLARGLLHVVKVLLGGLGAQGVDATAASAAGGSVPRLEGFSLFDVSGLQSREAEEDPAGSVSAGDTDALFACAMERIVAVCGGKWTKRALGITAPAAQLEFVWRAARFAASPAASAARDAELAALMALRERIVSKMPEETRGHFSVSEADLRRMAAELTAAGSGVGGAPSAISLESVGDALAEEADWSDWLETVMRLLLGYPMRLQLPKDKMGRPDFADSWSAVAMSLGIDRISASEFMRLVGDEATAVGPTDHKSHNALLVTVEPSDALATMVFRIASGTQVLNYVAGVLMGAKGFLPNLYAGTAAATLARLLAAPAPMTAFESKQAAEIVHCLRSLHRSPARQAVQELAAGRANPADPMSKLLACAVRVLSAGTGAAVGATAAGGGNVEGHEEGGAAAEAGKEGDEAEVGGAVNGRRAATLRLVLEEMLAAMVQRFYGKQTPEADREYLTSLRAYVTLGDVFGVEGSVAAAEKEEAGAGAGAAVAEEGSGAGAEVGTGELDPLTALHVLEEKDEAILVRQLRPDWAARVAARLRGGGGGGAGSGGPEPHPLVAHFERVAAQTLALLLPGEAAAAAGLSGVWPGWDHEGLLRALLLRFRTARYRCIPAPSAASDAGTEAKDAVAAPPTWELLPEAEVGSTERLAVRQLKEALGDALRGFRAARLADGEGRLVAAAAAAVRTHLSAGGPSATGEERAAAATDALATLYLGPSGTEARPAERPTSAPRGPVATLLDGSEARLDRSAVPRILDKLGEQAADPTFASAALRVLVLGAWTTAPPQALRNAVLVLARCKELELDDVLQALHNALRCTRTVGCNRLGHSAARPYPGPDGWTPEYAAERIAAKPKTAARVRQMQLFTEMAAWARAAAAAAGGEMPSRVEGVLMGYKDANRLPHALPRLEALLGQTMAGAA